MSENNGGRFTGFAPTFYMHRRYGRRSLFIYFDIQVTTTSTSVQYGYYVFGLTITKKEGVMEVVE